MLGRCIVAKFFVVHESSVREGYPRWDRFFYRAVFEKEGRKGR
jgi:hypothetical protein